MTNNTASFSPDQKLTRLAVTLADTARSITLNYFQDSLHIESKEDASPVTVADRETESALRQLISQSFPHHGIYGEEYGIENPDAESVWIIDPIDGTGAFICGLPLFGVLISHMRDNMPILGIIDMPVLGERWLGVSGSPTLKNGKPCFVSGCSTLDQAKLMATTPDMFNQQESAQFNTLSQHCRLRRFGGDCYSYALLASGQIDLVVESDLKPYDYMAHIPIVEGAGGIITDWQGHPLTLQSGPQIIAAASAELHKQALALLNIQ